MTTGCLFFQLVLTEYRASIYRASLPSQAKLENDNKSINVKRGLRTRCEMGLRPGPAVVGYLNEKRMDKKCEVVIDHERAPIVKQMFEKVAYEKWSGRKLYHWLKFDLNFKTRI